MRPHHKRYVKCLDKTVIRTSPTCEESFTVRGEGMLFAHDDGISPSYKLLTSKLINVWEIRLILSSRTKISEGRPLVPSWPIWNLVYDIYQFLHTRPSTRILDHDLPRRLPLLSSCFKAVLLPEKIRRLDGSLCVNMLKMTLFFWRKKNKNQH